MCDMIQWGVELLERLKVLLCFSNNVLQHNMQRPKNNILKEITYMSVLL